MSKEGPLMSYPHTLLGLVTRHSLLSPTEPIQ